MTRLEAIELMFRRAGRLPPRQLDTGGQSDAAQAENILDQKNLEIQSRGWAFNRVRKASLQPNADGIIAVPDEAIVIRSSGKDRRSVLVEAGGTLYNLDPDENTFVFDEAPETEYHLLWKFECSPYFVRKYVAESAAYEFINLFATSNPRYRDFIRLSMEAVDRAEADAFRMDTWQDPMNLLTERPEATRMRGYRPRVTWRGGSY